MNVLRFRPRNTAIAVGSLLILAVFGMVYLGGSSRSPYLGLRDTLGKGSRHFSAEDGLSHSRLLHEWGTIPVVVVEEHHEVIPHWYKAVKDGFLNPKGNLLIHIDGHSDSAPPIFFDGYPKDFYPRTKDHLTVMMQRNDAFIVEAALSGLISRYVWIWPKWDSENHDDPYEASAMLLGVVDTLYKNLDNVHIKSCCMCEPDEEMNPQSCVFINITSENQNGSTIDPKECDIKTVILQEIIREDVALEMARNGSLFHNMTDSERENVILDIDEDYYGCEPAVQPVLDQKLPMVTVLKIDRFVNKIFCPETTEEESSLDKVLAKMISELIAVKSCELEKKPSCPKGNLELYTTEVKTNTALIESICAQQRNKRLRLWEPFFKLLDSLRVNQLRHLREMGFCFRTTPKASDFGSEDEDVFRTCRGANSPNETVVIFHSPSLKEVEQRTHLLQTFLQSTKKKRILPSLVSVCRSMRDGYTPRKFFRRIERDVLTSVDDAFPNSKVHYDRDLMGGKRGWPGRHNIGT